MRFFLINKRDMFFGVIALSLLITSFSYAFGQYIRVKEHNLNVAQEMRLCIGERCDERAAQNYIFSAPTE